MSLIANLLKKVEPSKNSGAGLPPGLKRAVLESTRKQGSGRSRVTTIGLLALGVAACGVSALFVMDYLQKPLPKAKRPQVASIVTPTPAPPSPPAPAVVPVIAPPVLAQEESKQSESASKSSRPEVNSTTNETPTKKTGHPKVSVKITSKPAPAKIQAFIPAKRLTTESNQINRTIESTKSGNESSSPATVAQKKLSRDDLASRDAYLYSARSAETRGDYRQALEHYRKALDIDGNNHLLLNNSAGVLMRLGANDEASSVLNRCLELKPGYAPALVNKGIISIKSGNSADGEAWLNKALAADPDNRYALMSSGLLKEKTKDYKGAAAIYRKLVETGDGQGYVGMGRVAESEGNRAEAARIYRTGLGRDGLSQETRRQLGERLNLVER